MQRAPTLFVQYKGNRCDASYFNGHTVQHFNMDGYDNNFSSLWPRDLWVLVDCPENNGEILSQIRHFISDIERFVLVATSTNTSTQPAPLQHWCMKPPPLEEILFMQVISCFVFSS